MSVATVSRVLNNPHTVRDETRARVQRVIETLNFRPDPTARRLSIGRTFTIGVLLPFLTRASFVERLRGVEAALSHSAYDLVVSNVESQAKRDAYFDAIARERRFDGSVVMTLEPSDEEAQAILDAKVPVILVDASHPLLPGVDIDDVAGGRMAAAHLLERGHRRLAYLGDTDHELLFRASRERLAGFRERLEEEGLVLADEDIFWAPHGRREARQVADRLLQRPAADRPTALFAASDTAALGILDGLRAHEMKAPQDLAVIGFDDLDVAELYDLTTIHQPLFQSGTQGIEYLLALLESGQAPQPQQLTLPLTLRVRGTT